MAPARAGASSAPASAQGDTPILNESISNVPIQCTVTSRQVVLANGATIAQNVPYTPTLIAGQNTYTIRNVVTCQTKLTLAKSVQGGTEPVTSWTLDAVAPTGALAGPNGTSGSAGATGAAVTPGITYPLAEAGATTGALNYRQVLATGAVLIPGSTGSWTCQEVGTDGTTVIPGFADGLNGGVTVPLGKWVRCTAVNQTSTLSLRKVVQNTHGGTAVPANWSLTATPIGTFPAGLPPVTVTGATLVTPANTFNVRPGVDYRLTETGTPSGYILDSASCDIRPGEPRVEYCTLAPLDIGVCTFTNVDNPATLTLVKTVNNGTTGGTATPTQWTLSAAGPTPITGTSGSTAVTNAPVSAGPYTLSESTGPAGYTAGTWSCTGATVTGSTVTVPVGGNVSCTIVNTAQQARLTLVKTVTNDNGGTALPTAWTLAAAGPTAGISGATGAAAVTNVAVNPGSYTLSETGPAGYNAGAWSCTAGTLTGSSLVLALGQNATCTINNNDQAANLTLRKTVTNNNGGTAQATAWTLAAAGPTPISGITGATAVTNAPVNAGTYTLSETGTGRLHRGRLVLHGRHADRIESGARRRGQRDLHDHQRGPAGHAHPGEGRRPGQHRRNRRTRQLDALRGDRYPHRDRPGQLPAGDEPERSRGNVCIVGVGRPGRLHRGRLELCGGDRDRRQRRRAERRERHLHDHEHRGPTPTDPAQGGEQRDHRRHGWSGQLDAERRRAEHGHRCGQLDPGDQPGRPGR